MSRAETVQDGMSVEEERMATDDLPLDRAGLTELFVYPSRNGRGGGQVMYRRFETPREAVAYVVQRCGGPSAQLVLMEVDEQRFGLDSIRRLHRRASGLDRKDGAA